MKEERKVIQLLSLHLHSLPFRVMGLSWDINHYHHSNSGSFYGDGASRVSQHLKEKGSRAAFVPSSVNVSPSREHTEHPAFHVPKAFLGLLISRNALTSSDSLHACL